MKRPALWVLVAIVSCCGTPGGETVQRTGSALVSLGKADTEADAIVDQWPETRKPIGRLKGHIDDARGNINDIAGDADEGLDWFMLSLQGFLALSGIAMAVHGAKTADPWDTGLGAFGLVLSVVLNFYAERIATVFVWVVAIFGIAWLLIACKHYVHSKYKIDKSGEAGYS